jgi:WD40 repeat protein
VWGHFDGELWGLAIDPSGSGEYCSAGEDNKLCIWNLEGHRKERETQINPKAGPKAKARGSGASTMSRHPPNQCARCVDYSPNGAHIAVGTNMGEVNIYDAKTLELLFTKDLNKLGNRNVMEQRNNWIEMLRYSPSGKTLAVGTHGIVLVLLAVDSDYKPKQKLKAHRSSITCLDWSKDSKNIRSVCMAYELLFFSVDENDLKASKQVTKVSSLKDTVWQTQSCKFGWHVDGIFVREDGSEIADGSQINSVAANDAKSLIITGDDLGKVNLFRYPARKGSQLKAFSGHCSHIPRVQFALGDRYVVSAGGNDKAIIQWRIS